MTTPADILDFWFAEITPAQWWAKSDDFDRQVTELQVRAALLNRFTLLGTPVTVAMP